jgi:hypothetical protein
MLAIANVSRFIMAGNQGVRLLTAADPFILFPIAGIAACCARAASGHAAAPPSRVMNWRRLRSSPCIAAHARWHAR